MQGRPSSCCGIAGIDVNPAREEQGKHVFRLLGIVHQGRVVRPGCLVEFMHLPWRERCVAQDSFAGPGVPRRFRLHASQ